MHISYERHHRHSYYLIKNGDLRGFEPRGDRGDRARRALPPAGDAEEDRTRATASCSGALRGTVRDARRRCCGSPKASTAATRRRSPALDVFPIAATTTSLRLRTSGDAELELWAAHRHVAPLERVLGKPLRFEVAGPEYKDRHRMLNNLTTPHEYPGKLFVVEGIDGSGKTTQLGAAGEVA